MLPTGHSRCPAAASSTANAGPPKHASKAHASRSSCASAPWPSAPRASWQAARARSRTRGAQSASVRLGGCARASPPSLRLKSRSSSRTRPTRAPISSAVSSSGSPLRFPQCPSTCPPAACWLVAIMTSRCLAQRLTVRFTPGSSRSACFSSKFLIILSMCPCPVWKLAASSPGSWKSEGNSRRICWPPQVTEPSIGSTISVRPCRNGPPTARASNADWPSGVHWVVP
mmetsp:Transcript_93617/g.302509  ORF Transcript_93617/g.302509 Transcript_93617/m.302509 type:complete len:228 (-) Transcript_93617:12-695(-)